MAMVRQKGFGLVVFSPATADVLLGAAHPAARRASAAAAGPGGQKRVLIVASCLRLVVADGVFFSAGLRSFSCLVVDAFRVFFSAGALPFSLLWLRVVGGMVVGACSVEIVGACSVRVR